MIKTPLLERIQRYVDFHQPTEYIPIHIKDMGADGKGSLVNRLQPQFDLPIVVKFWGPGK